MSYPGTWNILRDKVSCVTTIFHRMRDDANMERKIEENESIPIGY